MQESVEEKLLKVIKKELDKLFKEYKKNNDPEMCDDICQALELCDKLLNNDYFYESERVIDEFALKTNETNTVETKEYSSMCNDWHSKYVIDLREKKKDLKKLFNIIVRDIEDWC